jgi:hypothetical protein
VGAAAAAGGYLRMVHAVGAVEHKNKNKKE